VSISYFFETLKSHVIDIQSWRRREHFLFFRDFEEPYFGLTVTLDCTATYTESKQSGRSFYLNYLLKILQCCNEISALRLRMPTTNEVWEYEKVHASSTETKVNKTFGYALIPFHTDYLSFQELAEAEIKHVRDSEGLFSTSLGAEPRLDVIHFSALPWLNFTSVSHARFFSRLDSVPKITVGKCEQHGDRYFMPISLHLHHALADGADAAEFFKALEAKL